MVLPLEALGRDLRDDDLAHLDIGRRGERAREASRPLLAGGVRELPLVLDGWRWHRVAQAWRVFRQLGHLLGRGADALRGPLDVGWTELKIGLVPAKPGR